MQSFRKLNPLKGDKEAYGILPTHESDTRRRERYSQKEETDEEYTDYDSEYSSTSTPHSGSSSRKTSDSYSAEKPMLKKKRTATNAANRHASHKLPRRVVQGCCWSMILIVIGFILFLVRMSHVSTRNIQDHKPALVPQWESFEFLTRYYGGIRTLLPVSENVPEYPRLEDEVYINSSAVETREVPGSKAWNAYDEIKSLKYFSEHEPVQDCFLDIDKTVRIPALQYHQGRTNGFPDNIMGSNTVLGLPDDICFERYGKLGPYGLGYGLHLGGTGAGLFGDKEGAEAVWKEIKPVDYREIDWADAQKRCVEANAARFNMTHRDTTSALLWPGDGLLKQDQDLTIPVELPAANASLKSIPRTAVVVRTSDEYIYREEDIIYLRTLISELSLGSGGEYDVHLLVQVKDESVPVWADKDSYNLHIKKSVPKEFWGITTLWSETQNVMFYSGLEETWARGENLAVHGAYRGLMMALQYFANNHLQYEYFWQWEMDIRYTGHYYSLFKQFDTWTTAQPRKGLWERNGRFYIPAIHGSWEEFVHMVRVQTEQGQESPSNVWSGISSLNTPSSTLQGDKPIWGPERPVDQSDHFEIDADVKPPTTYAKDKYTWGIDEPADLITLNPMFDPAGTTWGLATDATGYNKTIGLPPRRAAIITASRMSRKLLATMHRETAFGKHHAFSEMWPATVALHHGYKAVYVPHPTYIDREWPVPYLGAVFNAGRNGATGGARTSVFGDREHNFKGSTWYYNAGFAGNLWKRWLGLKVDGEGGEQFETMDRVTAKGKSGVPAMKGGEGRMCLPPMLLHPVKDVELIIEEVKKEFEETEFGPSD